MDDIHRICLLLTVDGYHVNGKFQIREMAFDFLGGQADSVSFVVDTPVRREDIQRAEYVFQHVHGLPVRGGYWHPCMVNHILEGLYDQHKSKQRPFVGIKGNPHAKALLERLHIQYVDLEKLGCPRFDLLESEPLSCGEHAKNRRCPRAMVAAYKRWMQQQV